MPNTKSRRARQDEKTLAHYQPLPGWPKTPTLELARRQQRVGIAVQRRYEQALREGNERGAAR